MIVVARIPSIQDVLTTFITGAQDLSLQIQTCTELRLRVLNAERISPDDVEEVRALAIVKTS